MPRSDGEGDRAVQIRSYALALEKCLRTEVSRRLFFTTGGIMVSVSLDLDFAEKLEARVRCCAEATEKV